MLTRREARVGVTSNFQLGRQYQYSPALQMTVVLAEGSCTGVGMWLPGAMAGDGVMGASCVVS